MSRQKYNKEIVCPHCDHRHEDSYDYFDNSPSDGDTTEIECANCESKFEAEVHISWEYSSKITECELHSLDLQYATQTFKLFECKNCFEEFYDHEVAIGQYSKLQDGEYEFVGKAKELMEKEKSEE